MVTSKVRSRFEIEGMRPSGFGGDVGGCGVGFDGGDELVWGWWRRSSVQECWWRRLWRISRGSAVVDGGWVEEDWVERRVVRAEGVGGGGAGEVVTGLIVVVAVDIMVVNVGKKSCGMAKCYLNNAVGSPWRLNHHRPI